MNRSHAMKAAVSAAATAAAFAVVLAVTHAPHSAPLFPETPARPHTALGEVRVLAITPAEEPTLDITEEARARFGHVDALAQVRTAPLPWSQAALVSGIAIRWD